MEHSEVDMKISSAKIRQLRSERGWSQEQLALASGLSLRTIQRVEAEGNASRETHVCLAATFGLALAELAAEEPAVEHRSAASAVPTRYKVTAALTGLTFIPVLLSFMGLIPAQLDLYVSLSFMAMIALFLYSAFGWFFTGAAKNPSQSKRAVQMLFIASAIFCGFASLSQSSPAELRFAAQIGLLGLLVCMAIDAVIAKRRLVK